MCAFVSLFRTSSGNSMVKLERVMPLECPLCLYSELVNLGVSDLFDPLAVLPVHFVEQNEMFPAVK